MAIYRGLSGPPGPETPKKSEKSLKKVPPRVWKKSRKRPFRTFARLFPDSRDFFQTLGGPWGRRPRQTFFQTFAGFRAWRARETPVNGQRAPNFFFNPGDLWELLRRHPLWNPSLLRTPNCIQTSVEGAISEQICCSGAQAGAPRRS